MNSKRKNLIKYVLPAILSNCSFYLLTIVDGIFVGNGVGTDALGAINIAFPFIMIVGALFTLMTIGGVTVAAIRLGRGDTAGANQAFMHALTGTVVIAAVLCAVGLFCTDTLAKLLGANDTFHDMVVDYLFWYAAFTIPCGLLTALSGFCRNDGAPLRASAAAIVCTVCNIFGDWLLIFPLKMGVAGAAIASGVSQAVAMLLVLAHFLCRRGRLRITAFRFQPALLRKLLGRGTPEMVSQFATPVMTLTLNRVLLAYLGDTAVNAFSIIGYVTSLFYSILFGTAGGLQPLFGQSYGAKDLDGLRFYFRRGILINLCGSALTFVLTLFIGGPVSRLFGADPAAYTATIEAMPKFSVSFLFSSMSIIISSYLYSTKRTQYALTMNILRGLVFNTASILLLPALFGSGVIWYTVSVAEALSLAAGVLLLRRSERNGIEFH